MTGTTGPVTRPLDICYVSPTHLGPGGLLGGGERYAEELARAMATLAPDAPDTPVGRVRLVSFGTQAHRERPVPGYERVILKSWASTALTPFSPALFRALGGADVIHCFQYYVLPTFLATAYGRLRRRRVFVSDLGGGGWTPGYHVDQSRWLTAHLPISHYAARALPGRRTVHEVIYGGVDPARYPMRQTPDHDGSVVFLGRMLPHKGIHHLVEAVEPGTELHLVGPALDTAYLESLHAVAEGKRVRFHHGLTDAEVVALLQQAMALVHPTPVDETGSARAHELLGLAPIEAMACGCPVVASDAASLPEVVADGVSGLLVPPNDPAAIRQALARLREDDVLWRTLSRSAHDRVLEHFTWHRVARHCLDLYTRTPAEW